MSGEKTDANMDSLATLITTPSSSVMGVETLAGIPARTSSKTLPITAPPPPTPLNTDEAFIFSPPIEYSPISVEANTSDPAAKSLPALTTFPDLNLKILILLARLKNPSRRSTEELQSALAEADTILSAWKSELLNIEEDQRREGEIKPAARMEIRPRNPITVSKGKDSIWKDFNQQKSFVAGIGGSAAERLKRPLAAEVGASRASSRTSEPVTAVAPGEAHPPLNRTIGMPHHADSLTPRSGRGQRAQKPRKFFGETSPASRYRRQGPHEGQNDQAGKRTRLVGHSSPKQEATRTEPKNYVAKKRKRDDQNEEEEEEENAAAEPSKKIGARDRSATQTPSQQQPKKKLILVLKTRETATPSRANPFSSNAERTPRTTHSTSRAATPAVAKKAVSEAAFTTPSKSHSRREA